MSEHTKDQVKGSGKTLAVVLIAGLIGWGGLKLYDYVRKDHDPDETAQDNLIQDNADELSILKGIAEQNTQQYTGLAKSRLRAERRILEKEMEPLQSIPPAARSTMQKDYLIRLEDDLESAEEELAGFE